MEVPTVNLLEAHQVLAVGVTTCAGIEEFVADGDHIPADTVVEDDVTGGGVVGEDTVDVMVDAVQGLLVQRVNGETGVFELLVVDGLHLRGRINHGTTDRVVGTHTLAVDEETF